MTPQPLVAIGTSMGGLVALKQLLSGLSAAFPWPLCLVQHRGTEDVGNAFVSALQRHCVLPVSEAEDKEPLLAGHVYIAPSDYHLLIEQGTLALSTEAKVCHARPSIDVLFDSASAACSSKMVAIVLTGNSGDGSHGAVQVKARGGTLIVQDPASAEYPVMPLATLAVTPADYVVGLPDIAPLLNRLAAKRSA